MKINLYAFRSWNTGFAERYLAPKLSHYSRAMGGWEIPSSVSSFCTHIISVVAFTSDLYSVSVLERDMVACFLALHEIKLSPRNTANPPVDRQLSTYLVQSASEKALTIMDFETPILRPRFRVPRIYMRILFTALQWMVVGACKNWQTLLIAKEISGLVSVKYCSALTKLLYLVESPGPRVSP